MYTRGQENHVCDAAMPVYKNKKMQSIFRSRDQTKKDAIYFLMVISPKNTVLLPVLLVWISFFRDICMKTTSDLAEIYPHLKGFNEYKLIVTDFYEYWSINALAFHISTRNDHNRRYQDQRRSRTRI